MVPELEHLIELQRLDTTVADAKARIAAHPQRLAEADARLADTAEALNAAKERLKTSQEERRALEKDAAVYQGRLSKFKDQLSAVKTNREYQAMQHEIETAQHELGVAEEKVIEHMVDGDSLVAAVKQAEAALAVRQKEITAEKKMLEAELAEVEAALTSAQAARVAVIAQLDQSVLARFELVSRQRKGIALTLVTHDGLCSACHVRLRPPVFQQVRQNASIVQCESCQRIMYYVPPPAPVEPARVHAP